jgi:hypothetical protein
VVKNNEAWPSLLKDSERMGIYGNDPLSVGIGSKWIELDGIGWNWMNWMELDGIGGYRPGIKL